MPQAHGCGVPPIARGAGAARWRGGVEKIPHSKRFVSGGQTRQELYPDDAFDLLPISLLARRVVEPLMPWRRCASDCVGSSAAIRRERSGRRGVAFAMPNELGVQ